MKEKENVINLDELQNAHTIKVQDKQFKIVQLAQSIEHITFPVAGNDRNIILKYIERPRAMPMKVIKGIGQIGYSGSQSQMVGIIDEDDDSFIIWHYPVKQQAWDEFLESDFSENQLKKLTKKTLSVCESVLVSF